MVIITFITVYTIEPYFGEARDPLFELFKPGEPTMLDSDNLTVQVEFSDDRLLMGIGAELEFSTDWQLTGW